jgi:urease accessory protein
VRTLVEVTAHPDGRLVHRAEGALAVRQTGSHAVHLAGTAAGPLDGDEVRVVLRVLAGARLHVRTVAASVVLAGTSRAVWELEVAEGACLQLEPEPTVVTARAHHRSEVRAALHAGAGLVLTERVQLGRAAEGPGRWVGLLHIDRDGRPLLRHEVGLGPGSAGHDVLGAPTALVSTLRVPDDAAADVREGCAVLPLAGGGTLTTELRERLWSTA